MLLRPSAKVLSALASLETDANFQVVLAWLSESRQDLSDTSCATRDEVLCRWQQGAVQAVGDLLDTAKTARASLNKSR